MFIVAWLKQYRTGRIAKKNAGRAVFEIGDGSHHVRPDNNDLVVRSRFDKLRANSERINESRASSGNIEAPRASSSNFVLDDTSGRREKHIRSNCRDDDEIDLAGFDSAVLE